MDKYRKKPVIVEAVRWMGPNGDVSVDEIQAWGCHVQPTHRWSMDKMTGQYTLIIPTLEGNMHCEVGDWIIRGVKGEYYPCKPDIFLETYECLEKEMD